MCEWKILGGCNIVVTVFFIDYRYNSSCIHDTVNRWFVNICKAVSPHVKRYDKSFVAKNYLQKSSMAALSC